MEFLYKLYSNNYFGIGLFIVITVLAFSFLVILFFGKRDEKVRNEKRLENHKSLEQTKIEKIEENKEPDLEIEKIEQTAIAEEPKEKTETVSLENNAPISFHLEEEIAKEKTTETPILDETLEYFEETPKEELDPFATSNIVLNTDYINQNKPDIIANESEIPLRSSDIYNLDSIMNEEVNPIQEESIDDVLNKYDAIEERIIDNSAKEVIHEQEYYPQEEQEINIFERNEDSVKRTSTPFSSVYLTKEEADTKEEKKKKKIVTPNKPAFEMPKRVDLPKRNSGAINESIISSIYSGNQENHTDNIFNNFEDDTYNLKK